MTKLRNVRLYNANDVPDHIMQEVMELTRKIALAIGTASLDYDYNIILSALNRCHAAMIVQIVTEDGLIDAARTEAIGLVKNIEHISGQSIFGEKE